MVKECWENTRKGRQVIHGKTLENLFVKPFHYMDSKINVQKLWFKLYFPLLFAFSYIICPLNCLVLLNLFGSGRIVPPWQHGKIAHNARWHHGDETEEESGDISRVSDDSYGDQTYDYQKDKRDSKGILTLPLGLRMRKGLWGEG